MVKCTNKLFGFCSETAELWLVVPSNPNTVALWGEFENVMPPSFIGNDVVKAWDVYQNIQPAELGTEDGVPVHIVTGPPGSGKRRFAA
jgi:hypothetical protein